VQPLVGRRRAVTLNWEDGNLTMATNLLMVIEADEAFLTRRAGNVVIPTLISVPAWSSQAGLPEFFGDLACRRSRAECLKLGFNGAIVADAFV
jgi:hypothetical protein